MAYDIEQVLINEANRIGPDIYRKTLNTSPWLKLVKKDTWPDEMGDTIRVLTYERSLPANTLAWNQISLDPVTSRDGTYANGQTVAAIGHGNNAVPSAQVIKFAQTLRSYNLTHTALESPKLSVNDLRFSLKRKEQLSNIFAILQENTSYAWQDRYRNEYTRLAQNKISAGYDSTAKTLINWSAGGDGSTFSGTLPTSTLVQGILDRVYQRLIRDGAGNNPLDRENARPVFGLMCSSETSRNLILQNPDIRQDYRWSSKSNELLSPLGIERSYAGFFHMIDDWNPRWDAYAVSPSGTTSPANINGSNIISISTTAESGVTAANITPTNSALYVGQEVSGPGIPAGTTVVGFQHDSVTSGATGAGVSTLPSGGSTGATGVLVDDGPAGSVTVFLSNLLTATPTGKVYLRRLPYSAVATTQGSKFDISSLYETAQVEDSIIFHQDVFSNLVPKPITAAGSNVTFDAVSYMGDFKWKNIITPDTNPDGTIGYFRAILSAGSKPIRPEWGTVIRHLRASTPLIFDGVTAEGGANVIATPGYSISGATGGVSFGYAS